MEIQIRKKKFKGDDCHKVLSIRVPGELLNQLDSLSSQANISRNELINIILTEGISLVKIKE